jgi:hypothetical protein
MNVDSPKAPNYAEANREGILTDIETLPLRLMAERAASEGKTLFRDQKGNYTLEPVELRGPEPNWANLAREDWKQRVASGLEERTFDEWFKDHLAENPTDAGAQEYKAWLDAGKAGAVADFTGLGDDTRRQRDIEAAKELYTAGADISRDLEKGRLADLLEMLPQFNELNLDQQKAAYQAALDAAKAGETTRLDMELEYRPKFTESELAAQEKAFDQSLDLSDRGSRRQQALQKELMPGLIDMANESQSAARRAATESLKETDPEAYAMRTKLGQQLLSDLDSEDLTPAQRRRVEQSMRMSQAARGNVLGSAAAFDEALAVSGYGEDLRRQRVGDAMNFLNLRDITPQFAAPAAANPLMPMQSAGSYNPNLPNFTATTAAGPNLGPQQITQGGAFNFTNANAGQQGLQYNMDVWNAKREDAQANANRWMEGLSAGAGLASSFI